MTLVELFLALIVPPIIVCLLAVFITWILGLMKVPVVTSIIWKIAIVLIGLWLLIVVLNFFGYPTGIKTPGIK